MVKRENTIPRSELRRLRTSDGIELSFEEHGCADAPSIVFAHGFGQTRGAWTATASALAASGWRAFTYDARGHGDSDWLPSGAYSVDQFIDDMGRLVAETESAPVIVGASMGGLVGMALAGAHPEICRGLVLVDVTPRWEPAGVARILQFMRAHPDGFANLDEAADEIARYLPHRADRKSPDRLQRLLVAGDDGRLRWHWDPRMLGPIGEDAERHQADLIQAARKIRVPTLLISGAASDVVSDQTIAEFLELVPHAKHVKVAKATHMVAGDENDAFARHVREFLTQIEMPECLSRSA
jgi:pimeloyl-ACP methyl ester carboxylesterase